MNNNIYIFGDSHSRSFSFRENIFPFFIERGSHFNLRMDPIKMSEKLLKVHSKCEMKESDTLFLYFGEPDCRFQLGHGTEPDRNLDQILKDKHRLHYVIRESKVDKEYLNKSVLNYIQVIKIIKDRIPQQVNLITPTTGYPPVFEAMKYFIEELKLKLPKDVIMIDTFSKVFNNVGDVKSKYLDTRERGPGDPIDRVHLNSNISEVFVKELVENNMATSDYYKYTENEEVTSMTLRSKFKLNPRFGTYTL